MHSQTKVYPEPQNALDVTPGMNVPNFPEGKRPKATDVSPWYGVYRLKAHSFCKGVLSSIRRIEG